MAIDRLPKGFVLDAPIDNTGLPSGFVLNQQQPQEDPSLLRRAAQKTGEFLGEIGPGVGELAVGTFQRGAELVGREDISARVGAQLERERAGLTGAQRAGRIAGQIIPFAGAGVATGARTAAKLGGGALARVAGATTAGAVGGGELSAVSPTVEGTREAALRQTAGGTVAGAIGGGVLSGAGQVVKGVRNLFKVTKPEEIIAKGLPAGQTAELLDQLKTATVDSPVLLPDIAGDATRGLTRSVGKLSAGRDVITDALEGRSSKAVERVSNQLARDVSSVDSYFGNLDDLAKARSEIAAPIYEKAFKRGAILDVKENKALFEKIAPDLADARRTFRLGNEVKDNSLVMLDAAKKSLDDKIGSAIRGGERQQAKALLEIKTQLVNKLDEVNPDYKKARQVFGDFASIQNAQEQGLQFTKLRPEELRRNFNKLPVSEKEAFRIGVRENLQKTVSSTAEGADPAKRIFGNSFKKKQIEAIFPSKAKFQEFEKRMIEETKAAETKFKVLGGSRTDINLADEGQVLSNIAKGGAVLSGGKIPLIGAAVSSIKNKFGGISDKNARQLANILVSRQKSVTALESILKKEQNGTQKRLISDLIDSVRPDLAIVQTRNQE